MTPAKARGKPVLYPTLGPDACDWIEEYLVHGPGDVEGQPIVLDSEFRAFIYRCYEVFPKGHAQEGRRRYRRAFLSRPKGRAKSELAGMLACYEALGECRFDGWRKAGAGYVPVGRPVVGPIVRCFATEQGQAGNTYDNVFYMLQNGTAYEEWELDVGLTRTFLPGSGEIAAYSSAAASKDGGKDTFDVFDETHLWILPSYKRLHATVTRNLIKRRAADGWALETSTMYAPGEASVAEETHKSSKSVPTVLFDHKQAPKTDIKDDEAVLAALRYVYGPAAAWMDLPGILNEFHDTQNRESDLRRYWFNEPWTTEEKFCTAAEWDALLDEKRTIGDGERVVLGLDGSFNRDWTALVVVTVDGVPHMDVAGEWHRPDQAPADWSVDTLDVEETIRQCCARWRVEELTADPYRWERTLQVIEEERACEVSSFPQTPLRMTPATSRFSDVVKSGSMTQSGDGYLREHVLNAILANDSRGKRLKKEHKKSAKHIDLAVAGLMALDRAAFWALESGYAHVWNLGELTEDEQDEDGERPDRVEREPRTGFRIVPQSETTLVRYDPSRGIGV